MRYNKLGALLFWCLFSLMMHAQTKEEQEIAKAVETLRQVMIHPDSTILKSLASEELVYVHSSGKQKGQWKLLARQSAKIPI